MREGAFRFFALLLFVCLIYYGYSLAANNLDNTLTVNRIIADAAGTEDAAGGEVPPDTTLADDVIDAGNPAVTILNDKGEDFFIDYRLERERTRSYQLELLTGLVENAQIDAASRKEAAQELLAVSAAVEKELSIESMIKAKGYADALVLLNQGSAVVIIKAAVLGDADIARIADIVTKSTGMGMDRVIIMPKA
ncbi:MAG: SpoIIIAH-like family protein [bacterium]